MTSPFPSCFVWGVATSSYQVEGGAAEDGRGPSIWDRFCARPGKVWNGQDGAVACDFYHRHRDDVGLMRELGVDAFRFSVAWPRVLPEGRGRVNQAGLDFYDRLVDELLESGIAPYPTLYHWDLPQALEDAGGWPARATAEAFAEYAALVAGRLGDRVERWTTQNEPWVAAWLGYGSGEHAPGRASTPDAAAAAHHLLLGHALAADAIRAAAPAAEVGIVLNLDAVHPASGSAADRAAAEQVDAFLNRSFLDPLFRGAYPGGLGWDPPVEDGDLRRISAPIDFLGVNNYTRRVVRASRDGGPPIPVRRDGAGHTELGWEVYPDGLREVLVRVWEDYAPRALYVTENGAAFADVREHDGAVRDPERVAYLEAHVGAVAQAIAAGAPVRGYFVWSLLDNFEWAEGYRRRFGLVYVDYPTLERVPKRSFSWYRDAIAAHRASHPVAAATMPDPAKPQ